MTHYRDSKCKTLILISTTIGLNLYELLSLNLTKPKIVCEYLFYILLQGNLGKNKQKHDFTFYKEKNHQYFGKIYK